MRVKDAETLWSMMAYWPLWRRSYSYVMCVGVAHVRVILQLVRRSGRRRSSWRRHEVNVLSTGWMTCLIFIRMSWLLSSRFLFSLSFVIKYRLVCGILESNCYVLFFKLVGLLCSRKLLLLKCDCYFVNTVYSWKVLFFFCLTSWLLI